MQRKQKIINLMLFCVMLLGITILVPNQVKAADNDFVIKNGVLKEYEGSDKSVEIPAGVKKIGKNVFAFKKIKSISIPSSVTTIGEGAFMCTNIKKLTIPKNVKKIGVGALYGCSNLGEVTVLNKKLKFLSSSYGESVFDGPSSGYIRDKITIKGYKGSTAEKLVEQLNERSVYAEPCRRFKKAVFKKI